VSSWKPNRAAITARDRSSRKANRYVLRPPRGGPCRASPTHSSLHRSASNRPNTAAAGAPSRPSSPPRPCCRARRSKWRCRVRSEGAHPDWARRIRATWAAVRAGFSRFNAVATSSTSAGVRGVTRAGRGTSASNPPPRQSRAQRSMVWRETRTGAPNGRPERAAVCALGQRPHQPSPRPGRQRRVDHLLDQLVTEQPDPPGPLGPPPGVVVDLSHLLPPCTRLKIVRVRVPAR
jgi:hypothetical protein